MSIPSRRLCCGRTALTVVAAVLVGLSSGHAAQADLKVVVTIKPIHALVAQVMGATGTPDVLVAGTASPHTYALKPSDIRKLAAATIVFRVSAATEPFTAKMAKTLPKSAQLVTLIEAPGLTTLPQREGGPFEAHDHHEAGGAHGQPHDDHDELDGHVWLDPANARAMVDQIARTLTAQAPELAATFAANAAAAKARIDRLDVDLKRDLGPVAGRPYAVFHDAYQYFEKRYGLTVVGSITVNPDVPPSGKRLSALRAKISKLGAACVFGEPNFDAKVIATVIEGSSARTGTLDPEGVSLPAGPDLYDSLMRNLASSLKGCLDRSA